MKSVVLRTMITIVIASLAISITFAQDTHMSPLQLRGRAGLLAPLAIHLSMGPALAVEGRHEIVRYVVRVADPGQRLFELTMALSCPRGGLMLHLPATTPGDIGLKQHARYLDHFMATDERGKPLQYQRIGTESWRVEVPERSKVIVKYRIHMNERDVLRLGTNSIQPGGGFLEGSSVFLYSEDYVENPIEVRFELPKSWAVVMLLPQAPDGAFLADNYRSLLDAPAQFGTFTERRIPVDDITVRLIFDSPLPPYDQKAFDANVRAIVREEISFFGAKPFSEYTILIHWRPDLEYGGGLEHGRAMILNIGKQWMINLPVNAAGTIAHEIFHAWNGEAVHPRELDKWDFAHANYSPQLWFVEGVTNYYAGLTLIRAGVLPRQDFFEMMSRTITDYENDPGREWLSLEEASIAEWIHPLDSLDYYGGGEVVGFLLDLTIRLETDGRRGLDDVIRNLYSQSRKPGYRGYSDAELRAAVREVASRDLGTFFDRHVVRRGLIEYRSILKAAGLDLRAEKSAEGQVRYVLVPRRDQTPLQARIWVSILH